MSDPVRLADLTTLGLGGPAPDLLVARSDDDVCRLVREVDARGEELLLVAGGSNLVVADAGVLTPVLKIDTRGVSAERDGADLIVTAAAGENWDAVVARFTADGWSGLASLSGIPGSTGATPIQNVGAYGVETSDVLVDVTVYDRRAKERRVIPAERLGLGYRTSILRGTSDAVVLAVRMRLTHAHVPVRYAELAATLGVAPGHTAPPAEIRQAVLALRRSKGMVLDPADPDTRSVGSFFTNPLLNPADAERAHRAITGRLGPDVRYPHYPAGASVKLSAAWLIEKAGFAKGFQLPGGGAAVSSKHTLALTNRGGTTEDLLRLARHLRDGVREAFDVDLRPEPILVGVVL